ncbi:MAG: class I SAM-dependent methyltransferase [Planctomycetaceae bacterium]|nr:class I SAM-dependent methyltransferase [Planctomycetaceae bacterium]
MRRLILHSRQSPGDILMLTAAVRDLHRACPGVFLTDVRTSAPELWRHNPYLTPLEDSAAGVERLEMHYPLIHQSNQRPYHFLHGYAQFLESRLNVKIPLTEFRGDIHLDDEERKALPAHLGELPDRFWILMAGGKYDFTAKWWNPESYQKVVDHFQGRTHFVQCGEAGHWHPPLMGVANLVGKTSIRDFVRLMHFAEGVICPVTFAMHLAAAVPVRSGSPPNRACVVIAGGREPPQWESYPQHQYLHTIGQLDCCATGGCWKSRCQPVGDGDRKDRHDRCVRPVSVGDELTIPQCLAMIRPEDVIRSVERTLEGWNMAQKKSESGLNYKSDHIPRASRKEISIITKVTEPAEEGSILVFPHDADAVIEFTSVLRHLRHYYPERSFAVAVHSPYVPLLTGSCARVLDLETTPLNGNARRISWPDASFPYPNEHGGRAATCLRDEFQLSPLSDLDFPEVIVRENLVSGQTRQWVDGLGNGPLVLVELSENGDDRDFAAWSDAVHACEGVAVTVHPCGGDYILQSASGKPMSHGISLAELAQVVGQSRLVVGSPNLLTRLGTAAGVPTLVLWGGDSSVGDFPSRSNLTHLIPPDRAKDRLSVKRARRLPRFRTWPATVAEKSALVAELWSEPTLPPSNLFRCIQRSQTPETNPDGHSPARVDVRFHHGLGDCAYFARLIALYAKRGLRIGVECPPNKELLIRAAGGEIVRMASLTHDWGYPPQDVSTTHGQDWQGSKPGWNLSQAPLPDLGSKESLWHEFCQTSVRPLDLVGDAERKHVGAWLAAMPRPILLLHTKGNTAQQRKSLPDRVTEALYRELVDRCDGTLILLDWDKRVSQLAHYRVRHLSELSGGCSTERLYALFDQSDLLIGVDSGPLHAATLSDIPRVGVWMPGHYPARYCLPDPRQLNLVLSGATKAWNRFRRVPWNLVEQPGTEFDAAWIADQAVRMLSPARYLTVDNMAADVQLQQWIGQWCRGPYGGTASGSYADRHRSFDRLFQEAGRRFTRPNFVETGTIRSEEDWGGAGFFTYLAATYLHRVGGRLQSVDLSPAHCEFARVWTADFGGTVSIHCQDSLAFLRAFQEPIDVLYVDSLDTYEPGHAEHALEEVRTALPRLHERSLILIDDTPSIAGVFSGKGALAVPWLQEHGWELLYAGYQVLLQRRPR